jgi:hypothetical protein
LRPVGLNVFARNVYSQSGEDGIIEKILEIAGPGDRACVEFGAHDGKSLSNTHQLLAHQGWSGVLIEASRRKFRRLTQTYVGNDRVQALCAFVGYERDQRLDVILSRTPIGKDFSVLSLDVDGVDYYIWEALTEYRPRVVVIEFNPSFPVDVDWLQPKDMRLSQGCSLRALTRLASVKGYELVATTKWNAFFVVRELYSKFRLTDNSPEALWDGREFQTRLFQLYDGTLIVDGCDLMLWHDIRITPRIQVIPPMLREYPGRMNVAVRAVYEIGHRMSKWYSKNHSTP